MSSGMFRDKDFSNRIELSRLVQDLQTFGDLGSLQLPAALGRGQMGWGASEGMGGVPRHMHTHMHARTRTKHEDKHVRKLQMAATMEAAMFIMFNMHACVCAHACMHVHTCVGGCPHPTPTPTPTHPSPRGGTPPNQ